MALYAYRTATPALPEIDGTFPVYREPLSCSRPKACRRNSYSFFRSASIFTLRAARSRAWIVCLACTAASARRWAW